ncbi:hypothetical protein Syun_014778 [Stephania yunnanensis]|uniref:Uncharacterized protein n=1 Tax=Stephania yunnanensis TaxID=152371 RepID=A0AAP0JJZ2_9MAGN
MIKFSYLPHFLSRLHKSYSYGKLRHSSKTSLWTILHNLNVLVIEINSQVIAPKLFLF